MPKDLQPAQAHYVDWFRKSSPYIHAHRGRTFVICFGGEAIASEDFTNLMHDIALLSSLGVQLVLVHGARPQIDRRMQLQGLETQYAQGLRITDEASLACVKEAVGAARMEVEAELSKGLANIPSSDSHVRVTSGNFVYARPMGVREGIDFCHTGEVRRIDTGALRDQLKAGNIVLLSSIGFSPTGEVFNLSAEDVAQFAATRLKADKLFYLVEAEQGVPDGEGGSLNQLSPGAAAQLLADDRVPEPLRRSLGNAVRACRSGVRRAHLVSRHTDGALLQELYTRDGIGTLVTNEIYEGIRQAGIEDVGGILEVIAPLEESGILVRRSRELLEMEIERFTVVERDGMVVGCAGLYPYSEEGMAEIACFAVHPDYRGDNRGDALLEFIQRQASHLGLRQVFVLTTQSTHWFRERGFQSAKLDQLPMAKQGLYNYQRNSKVLIKTL